MKTIIFLCSILCFNLYANGQSIIKVFSNDSKINISQNRNTIYVSIDSISRKEGNSGSFFIELENLCDSTIQIPKTGFCWNDAFHISKWSNCPESKTKHCSKINPKSTGRIEIKWRVGKYKKTINKQSYLYVFNSQTRRIIGEYKIYLRTKVVER